MLDGLEVTPKLLYGKWRLNRHAEDQIPRLNNLLLNLGSIPSVLICVVFVENQVKTTQN